MLKLLIDILEHDWNLNSNNQSIFENKHQWSFKFQIVFIYTIHKKAADIRPVWRKITIK